VPPKIRTIKVEIEPDSDLAHALRASRGARLILIVNNERYRVEPEVTSDEESAEEIWVDFNPERFLEGITAAAGSWSHLDTERMKENIRRWRQEGSRHMDKP
jgi:hypothetical protein